MNRSRNPTCMEFFTGVIKEDTRSLDSGSYEETVPSTFTTLHITKNLNLTSANLCTGGHVQLPKSLYKPYTSTLCTLTVSLSIYVYIYIYI